ncbi:hypothetical protein HHL11_20790 [Ramlibacter sp. G-1-2-2]|uniref:Uncharacterized protein n=1 Tax=Ramlibacter agri TaxID=2728837 RepID=A0A848HF23_9BURK|nr:hypothetical protein [Ramlibacter agri]NML46198.1 hypothetical protein [Ramlibacter agri]
MSNPLGSLFGALIGATAYVAAEVPQLPASVPDEVRAEIRHARVELYCDHRDSAINDIRAACTHLRQRPGPLCGETLARLEQANWLVRRRQFGPAQDALERALASLETLS